MPLVRRAFPQLFSNTLVGVQPVSKPQGIAYAMRFLYGGTDSENYDPMSECYTIDVENEEQSIDDILQQAWNNVSVSVPSFNSTSPFKQPYKAPTIKTQFKKQKRKR